MKTIETELKNQYEEEKEFRRKQMAHYTRLDLLKINLRLLEKIRKLENSIEEQHKTIEILKSNIKKIKEVKGK